MGQKMQLNQEMMDGQPVLHLKSDRLDAAVVLQFKDFFREIAEKGAQRLILDMKDVQFMDSSGLGAVVAAMKSLGPGRKLDLANLTQTVEKVFKLTRMDTVFKIYPTVDDAIKS